MPPASQDSGRGPVHGERAGERIDRYELIEALGAGGMGSVWRARQSEPIVRHVALKIIKLGMDTREVVLRFEAERQALAVMDHPHIAKVLDGGATSGGRPYFVMELVEGLPITEHCDRAGLGVRARLELFVKVCEGIQHAHQKGLIHRDIKPGNVLVALQDGVPVPKVIDFGIAKATAVGSTGETMRTELGQMLGTPEYMAPEQLGMSGLDIDTRADVYSLGVLLYELLTGTTPFDVRKIVQAGYDELLRTIREVDPELPSTRVTRSGNDAPTTSMGRPVDARALRKRLSGDLDWIVMRALEKDRERRYESADGLAADVGRFLNQEPVEAAPPSTRYRVGKLVRRHKKTVAALAVIALLFLAGSIGTGIGLWRTMRANAALDVALGEKEAALVQEERQRTLAQRAEAEVRARAQELEQVAAFQSAQLSELDPELMGVRLRRALIEAAPEGGRDALIESLAGLNFTSLALRTLEEDLFGRTLEAIDAQFAGQPLLQARLLATVAATLEELGLLELASDPARRALSIRRAELGDEHPDTLQSIDDLGGLLRARGLFDEAEACSREALDGRRRVLGDEHPDTLRSVNHMGFLLHLQGRLEEAEAHYREALRGLRRVLGAEHRETLTLVNNVGAALEAQGRLDEAEPYYREALDGHRRVLGDGHSDTLASMNNLGVLLHARNRPDEAEPYYREALDSHRRVLGDEHPSTLLSIQNMGAFLQAQGRLDEAEPYLREALDGCRRVLGDQHSTTLMSISNMGLLLQDRGQVDQAERLLREALDGRRRALGDEHPDTLMSIHNLGFLLEGLGRLDEAEPYYREALDGARRVLGEEHPATLRSKNNLGVLLQALGRLEEAEPHLRETLDARLRAIGSEDPRTLNSIHNLRALLQARVMAARREANEERLGSALSALGAFELAHGPVEAAEAVLGEALMRLESLSADEPRLQRVRSELGAALASRGRLAEAEPLIGESAEWMLANPEDPGAGAALRRIVDLYDAWHAAEPEAGHDARAASWREELEAWRAGYDGDGSD